jgi:hypothetical protein
MKRVLPSEGYPEQEYVDDEKCLGELLHPSS